MNENDPPIGQGHPVRPALGNLHKKGQAGGEGDIVGPNTFKVTVLPLNLRLTIVLCLWRIGWMKGCLKSKTLSQLAVSFLHFRPFPGYTASSFRGTIAINPIPPTATTTAESEIYCATARNIWSSCTSLSVWSICLSFTSQYNVSLRKTNELVWVFLYLLLK